MYKYGDKFNLENVNLTFEVLGVFPGGQQRIVSVKENTYRVKMNGQELDIVESQLNILLEAQKKEVVLSDGDKVENQNEEVKENGRPESGPGSGRVRFGRK